MLPLFSNHPLHFSKLSIHLLVAVNATFEYLCIREYLFIYVSISLCAVHEYPSNTFVYMNIFSYTFEYLCVQLPIDSIPALDSKICNKFSSAGLSSCLTEISTFFSCIQISAIISILIQDLTT